jgi:hypothetical protein
MEKSELIQALLEIADNSELLEVARLAVEDELIERRDDRVFVLRNNGLVVKEIDSTPSAVIRMSSEDAISTGLKAIAYKLGV